jgi:dolichol kinase
VGTPLERALQEVSPAMRFELRRKVLHVLVAVVAVPALLLLPFGLVLGLALAGILVIALVWAIDRRYVKPDARLPQLHAPFQAVLRATRRPGEDFPWSPVLYTTALIVIGLAHVLLGLPWALAFAAFAILGLGDAASALVGVAYGRTKLAWNRRKSWEGTAAGFVAGFLAGLLMASIPYIFDVAPVPPALLGVVAAGAAAGALAETIPRVEDNLVVPLAAAAAMFALASAIGLPAA